MTGDMKDDSPYEICVVRESGRLEIDTALLSDAVIRTLRIRGCRQARIGVALVDDSTIARLNAQYLGQGDPTDVISFDLADEGDDGVEGEVVISTDTAVREAAARGHDAVSEVLLYAVHGTLHLLGMEDGNSREAARMHELEDEVLCHMGVGPVFEATEL